MRPLPKTGGEIFDTDVLFTPDEMPRAWDMTMEELESLGAGSASGLDPLITGYGRIAGRDYFSTDATAPRVPSSPALVLEIPNAMWFVEGRKILVDEPNGALIIAGVPANAQKYGYISAREIEDSGGEWTLEITPEHWFDELQPELSAAGLACIGHVTSDFDSVTDIDGADVDVIVPNFVLSRVLKNLLKAPTGGGGGILSFMTTQTVSPEDSTTNKAYVDGLIQDLAATIESTRATGGVDAFPDNTTILVDHVALLTAGVGEVNPPAIERLQISVMGAGFGHGQNSTPDFSPDTNDPRELPFDPRTGTSSP